MPKRVRRVVRLDLINLICYCDSPTELFIDRHEQIVELLLKHGARVDVEARMCWPRLHNQNCEERGKYSEFPFLFEIKQKQLYYYL